MAEKYVCNTRCFHLNRIFEVGDSLPLGSPPNKWFTETPDGTEAQPAKKPETTQPVTLHEQQAQNLDAEHAVRFVDHAEAEPRRGADHFRRGRADKRSRTKDKDGR